MSVITADSMVAECLEPEPSSLPSSATESSSPRRKGRCTLGRVLEEVAEKLG